VCKKPGPKLLVISHDDRFQALFCLKTTFPMLT
jgi:hypothetical protein